MMTTVRGLDVSKATEQWTNLDNTKSSGRDWIRKIPTGRGHCADNCHTALSLRVTKTLHATRALVERRQAGTKVRWVTTVCAEKVEHDQLTFHAGVYRSFCGTTRQKHQYTYAAFANCRVLKQTWLQSLGPHSLKNGFPLLFVLFLQTVAQLRIYLLLLPLNSPGANSPS